MILAQAAQLEPSIRNLIDTNVSSHILISLQSRPTARNQNPRKNGIPQILIQRKMPKPTCVDTTRTNLSQSWASDLRPQMQMKIMGKRKSRTSKRRKINLRWKLKRKRRKIRGYFRTWSTNARNPLSNSCETWGTTLMYALHPKFTRTKLKRRKNAISTKWMLWSGSLKHPEMTKDKSECIAAR